MVDLDPIKVEVQVLEAELGFLAEGRRADVSFAAYPGERFAGRIETINPVVDPESRTGRVTVLLSNPDHRIKPGMYAEVSLDAEVWVVLEDLLPVELPHQDRDIPWAGAQQQVPALDRGVDVDVDVAVHVEGDATAKRPIEVPELHRRPGSRPLQGELLDGYVAVSWPR